MTTKEIREKSDDNLKHELAEAQKRTDQQMKDSDGRLGILIRMMDEFIRRNGSKAP